MKSILGPLSKSLLSQIIGSGTNFALMLYLVRAAEQAEFGYFGVAYAVVVLFSGFFVALIGLQYVVNINEFNAASNAGLLAGFLTVAAAVSIGFVGLAVLASVVVTAFSTNLNLTEFIGIILAASVALGLNQSLVKFAFSLRRENLVLLNYVAIALVLCALLALNYWLDLRIDATTALLYLALSQGAAGMIVVLLLRPNWHDVDTTLIRHIFRTIWSGGKWAMMSSIVYNVRSQAHNFIVAPLLGPAALAQVNAARLLVQPAMLAVPPFLNVFMPRLVQINANSPMRLSAAFMRVLAGITAISLAYILVLLLSLDHILVPVLGEEYSAVHLLVYLWCGVFLISSLRAVVTMLNQVFKLFSKLMWANALVALMLIPMTLFLVTSLNESGAVFALLTAEAVLIVVLAIYAVREFQKQRYANSPQAKSEAGV